MKRWSRSVQYVFMVIGIAVLAFLVMDFNSRMAELRRLRTYAEKIDAQVTDLVHTQVYLEEQVTKATSEAAVEAWAYQEGKMVREGDHPIVILTADDVQPVSTPSPAIASSPVENWQVWIALFFDARLP